MSHNPYEPPKSDLRKRGLDRFNQTIDDRDQETDWISFFFIVLLLFIFFFHRVLFDFFFDIFRTLLYNE